MRADVFGLGAIEIQPFGPGRQVTLAPLVPAARAARAWFVDMRAHNVTASAEQLALATAQPALHAIDDVITRLGFRPLRELLATTSVVNSSGRHHLSDDDDFARAFKGHEDDLHFVLALALVQLVNDHDDAPSATASRLSPSTATGEA